MKIWHIYVGAGQPDDGLSKAGADMFVKLADYSYEVEAAQHRCDVANVRIAQLEAALRRAVNPWTHHFGWCAKNGQMPMVHDKMYISPDDWDAWRATIACTCAVAELLPTSMETKVQPPVGAHPVGGPCIHVWALTNRSAVENGKCELCGNTVKTGEKP